MKPEESIEYCNIYHFNNKEVKFKIDSLSDMNWVTYGFIVLHELNILYIVLLLSIFCEFS